MIIISNVVYVQIVIKILLITWSEYRDVCFKLALFYNNWLLYDIVVTFYTYKVLDVSRSHYDCLDWLKNNNINKLLLFF